jgi:hypothetical protein
MAHEPIIVFKVALLDPYDLAIVPHSDKEVAALGIEEHSNGLGHGVRYGLIIPAKPESSIFKSL